jgi:hypothetical protein
MDKVPQAPPQRVCPAIVWSVGFRHFYLIRLDLGEILGLCLCIHIHHSVSVGVFQFPMENCVCV